MYGDVLSTFNSPRTSAFFHAHPFVASPGTHPRSCGRQRSTQTSTWRLQGLPRLTFANLPDEGCSNKCLRCCHSKGSLNRSAFNLQINVSLQSDIDGMYGYNNKHMMHLIHDAIPQTHGLYTHSLHKYAQKKTIAYWQTITGS